MAGLAKAFQAVADACQRAHGDTDAITLTRVGGSATVTPATVYRERSEWRRTKNDREQVLVRRVVLEPEQAAVPVGSTFTIGTTNYTVELVSRDTRSTSQTLKGTRTAAASVSRPGYYGRD